MKAIYDVPTWTPLEQLAAKDKRIDLGDFMFMGTYVVTPHNGDTVNVHAYKHSLTRRYINLDDAGNFYVYAASLRSGEYVRTLDTEGCIIPAIGTYVQPLPNW